MSLQLLIRPGLPPGRALLKLAPANPGAVSIQIGNLPRSGEPALFLNPHLEKSQAWQPVPHEIVLPVDWPVTAADGGLEVEIGAELLWHLLPGRQYEARATVTGSAAVIGRVSFPKGLVLLGERPTGWLMASPAEAAPRKSMEVPDEPIVPVATGPDIVAPAAASEATPPPPQPSAATAQPAVAADSNRQDGGHRGKLLATAAGALLIAGAVAAYMFTGRPATELPLQSVGASAKLATDTLADVRSFLATNPTADAARQRAEALGAAGQLLDGQFLLHRYAADKGDIASARALGSFYDPSTWAADKSPLPAPNPVEAARWYQQAAEAGDAESQYRYAQLLRSGRTDDPDGPERSVAWLGKAAAQGHAAAKQALSQ